MKSYEEVARNVFSRREEYESKRAQVRDILRRTTIALQVLTVAVLILFTTGIGYALATGTGIIEDFLGIFQRTGTQPLSKSQQNFISDTTVELGKSVTCGGFTITAKGALTDGTTALILLDITAPDGMDVDSRNIGINTDAKGIVRGENPEKYLNSTGLRISYLPLDDGDSRSNTCSMMIRVSTINLPGSHFSFADGYYRYLNMDALYARQQEYPYTRYTIAEGSWNFKFLFTDVSTIEKQLLDSPIMLQAQRATTSDVQTATVDSIVLNGLSVVFYYTFDSGVSEPADFGDLQIVLKDGTVISAHPQTAVMGEANTDCVTSYIAQSPIIISEVDHIKVGNDVTIPVP